MLKLVANKNQLAMIIICVALAWIQGHLQHPELQRQHNILNFRLLSASSVDFFYEAPTVSASHISNSNSDAGERYLDGKIITIW